MFLNRNEAVQWLQDLARQISELSEALVQVNKSKKLNPQYVTDPQGNRTAVILPIEEYDELLEDLEDLATIAGRRDEPFIPHEQVLEELRNDGCLPD